MNIDVGRSTTVSPPCLGDRHVSEEVILEADSAAQAVPAPDHPASLCSLRQSTAEKCHSYLSKFLTVGA